MAVLARKFHVIVAADTISVWRGIINMRINLLSGAVFVAFSLCAAGCEGGRYYVQGSTQDGAVDTPADVLMDSVVDINPDLSTYSDAPPATSDECGNIKAIVFPIVNGVTDPDPTVVNLTPGQIAAIGEIEIDIGSMCTATVIAPNVVLTAAHCLDFYGIGSITFNVGPDSDRPDQTFHAREWHSHPRYNSTYDSPPQFDVAIILLSGDTTGAGITPIPANCETTSLRGQRVQAVGYGMTSAWDYSNTRRWWTVLTCDYESAYDYGVYGNRATGACYGDSGGPILLTKPDGNVYVMGDLSVGDSDDCLGHDYYPRTDYHCEFIQTYTGVDPCAGETLQGRCDGTTAIWCEADAVRTEDCAASGNVCGLDGSGNYRCVPAVDPCGDETFEGRCEGNTAIWCEYDAVQTMVCPEGMLCGDLGEGLNRCVDECTLIGMQGRCDENNFARWCEDGVIKVRDCTLCGQTCGWMNVEVGYYCL